MILPYSIDNKERDSQQQKWIHSSKNGKLFQNKGHQVFQCPTSQLEKIKENEKPERSHFSDFQMHVKQILNIGLKQS